MVTTDTAQNITASKTFKGTANIYVQSGDNYTASDTLITNRMISASQISGSMVSANDLVLPDATTAGHGQLRVRDFTDNLTDYRITVPTKNGTMALTSDIPTVSGTNDGTNWTSLTIGSNTYAIGSGSVPTNMMTTNTNQTGLKGNKEFNASYYHRFGALNSGNPWTQISNTQVSNNNGAGATAYFSNGIMTVIDTSTQHYIQAKPDYLEYSLDGGSTSDKMYFDDIIALIAYAKSQGWIS